MNNEEKLKAIAYFQDAAEGRYGGICLAHPLTCGNDSTHNNLVALEKDSKVLLECPDCDYAQEYIPEYVYEFYGDRMAEKLAESFKSMLEKEEG